MSGFRIFSFVLLAITLTMQVALADSLRVTPEWLKTNLGKENLVVIDSRSKAEYEIDHIVGAINFPDALTYQQKSSGGQIVEADIMQRLLRERGIDYGDTIVIYDAGQIIDAARVFWAFEVYGLKNVKVMTTGYDYWVKNKYPITAEIQKANPSNYVVSVNHQRIASKFSTQLAVANPRQIVVDARNAKSYRGEQSTAKRFGHIPTAINIPITHNLELENGTKSLMEIDDLKKVYSNLSIKNKVITYCEIGRASSTIYLALRELGYDVANYDASWREWGNDFSLPIEK